jgi:hypothetical protein
MPDGQRIVTAAMTCGVIASFTPSIHSALEEIA